MEKQYEKIPTALVLSVFLSACSGGNSGGEPEPNVTSEGNPAESVIQDDPGTGETTQNETSVDDAVFPPVYQTPEGVAECSVEDIKRRVEFDMKDYYLFYDQVPNVDLADYETPEELIRALRVDPDRFSNVQDTETQSNQSDFGLVADYGFHFRPAADGVTRFQHVNIGSPAYVAGIRRGDEVRAINGEPVDAMTNDDIARELSAENSPVFISYRSSDDTTDQTALLENEQYYWRSAGNETRFTSSDQSLPTVGYMAVRAFLDTTANDIDAALQEIKSRGEIGELIIDLRNNLGGRTWVATRLASIIAGDAVDGNIFLKREWNDKYSDLNQDTVFDNIEAPLNLPRVFVLTTDRTSSASEAFINGLEPYIDVIVIGDVTGGKPFTSNAREYCGKTINAIRSVRTNALGVSVSGGIQPDCFVRDNWETALPSVQDPLTRGALDYVSNGVCSTVFAKSGSRKAEQREETGAVFERPALFIGDE